LTAEDRVLLGDLANDLPALWQAPTTLYCSRFLGIGLC
jgi:hypothetical protein